MNLDDALVDLQELIFESTPAAKSMNELNRQMAIVRGLEAKLAEIEWELERSSYLIHEEPDLEDLL